MAEKDYLKMSKSDLAKEGQIVVAPEVATAIIEKHGDPVRMKMHGSELVVLYYDPKQKEGK